MFDIAAVVRVGALDGRYHEIEKQALQKITNALTPHGCLFIDVGNPLKKILLDAYRTLYRKFKLKKFAKNP